MAINKKLIHFKTKQKFEEELAKGNILNTSIVFILDTTEIYTHGLLYDGSKVDLSNIEASILNILDNYATKKELPTKLSLLTNDANYVLDDILTSEFSIKAVSATGELLDLDLADTSCVAVAYRGDTCSFIISKHDVLNSSKFYWGKNLKGLDVPNLDNFSSMGSLLNDFNGSLNTKAIISSYDYFGVEVDDSDMCKGFETYKETYTDWYIPTAAQLLLLFYYINEINEMLNKIGGTPLSTTDYYWSSTEHSANQAWVAKLTNGKVLFNLDKDTLGLLRLVRDTKTIKLRINIIESKVTELEINAGNIPVVNHGTSDTTFELTPNVFHKWDTVSELTLTLAESDEDIYNEYMFLFTSGDTATTFSIPNTVLWVMQPNILNNRTYQCSILNNIGVFVTV